MYKLTVVAIHGCKMCGLLIAGLGEAGIDFQIVDVTENESLGDMLEVLLKTTRYPIATFEIPSQAYFICTPDDPERLGWKTLDDTSTSVGVVSPHGILDTIKQLIKKI